MKKRLLSITKLCKRRTNNSLKEVRDITGTMADIAKQSLKAAKTYVKKLIADSNGDAKLHRRIHETIETVDIIVSQTESVNQGIMPTNRVVSFADTDARPISKGNASDKHHLTPALTSHHKIFKKQPRELAADAGYFSKQNEDAAYELG